MSTILIVILVILLLGGFGGYHGYNRYGGAGLGGVLGLVLIVVVVLWLVGGRRVKESKSLETRIPPGPTGRNRCRMLLSVAAARRASLPASLDSHGFATAITVPTQPNAIPIVVAIANAIAVASAFTDTDPVGTDRHVGLGQRDGILRNRGGACEGGECRQAEYRRKYQRKCFHESLQIGLIIKRKVRHVCSA